MSIELQPYVYYGIYISAATLVIGVFAKLAHFLRTEKPDLVVSCEKSYWVKQHPTSTVTTVRTLIIFENKGQLFTTVRYLEMTLDYRGMKYLPIQSEAIDIFLEAGATIRRGIDFQIPINTLSEDDAFDNAKFYVTHAFGRRKPIQINKIMHYAS